MKNFKKLLKFMEGYKLIYFLGMLSILISQLFTTITPLVLQTTIDNIIGDKPIESSFVENTIAYLGGKDYLRNNLWIIGIIIISIAMFRGLFLLLRSTMASKTAESTAKRMRDNLYDHIQRLPYEYHVKAETGDLIQRCTSDVDTIRRFLAIQLVEVSGSLFMLGFILTIIFRINIKMALISILVLPFTFLFAFIFFSRVKKSFEASDEAEAKMTTTLQENLTGIRVVKAFARQKYEVEKFDEKNKDYQNLTYKLLKELATYWGISDFFSLGQVGLVVIFGGILTYRGELSLGSYVAFISYINMLVWPVRQLGRMLTDMGKAFVSLERIDEILKEPIEILFENNEKPEIKGNIEFNNVSFQYEKNKPVLNNISFKVKAGETLALIGPTGSGKSSLVHLLARLYEYNEGSIKIDGIELNTIDKGWIRKNVGLVLQEPFLYAKTIRENIKLANPSLKDEKVVNAAKVASIHEDIKSFEKGYDTFVGERGVSLSGGQKQRMSIARTIINDCPIVIFDDSLSAVDTETDISIRKALNKRRNKATTIIISHRISTVSEADQILVIDKGKIVQRGSHHDLIKEEGLYKRVYNIQSSLDDELIS
ncbi:MAG: ABC transporter ATP-binding protein [Tissierellia bacterium]|nr:ABC transporter ATP-binding protein [Tissierellia bacterium]